MEGTTICENPFPGPMARLRIPTRAEVVVVGGGCMGASTAFHLARRGVDVVLVERGHIGSGATGHSGAIIRQHYETRLGIGLARRSLLFFRRFKEETGHSCDFHETGFLSGTRAPDVPAFDALLRLLTSEGVRAERLSPDGAQQLEPQLAVSDYVALVHDPEAGYADPAVTAVGFAKAAESLGGTIRQDVDVRGLVVRGGQIAGVRLGDGGQIKTSNVVLAAGTWTRMLARAVGVRLPIHFVRGEVAILRRPVGFGRPPRIHFDFYGNTYSRPEGEKDVLVGYMDARPHRIVQQPVLREASVPTLTIRDLTRRLTRRFPSMTRAQPRGGWAGLYDVSPDSYPILDAVGPRGLFVEVGFSGHGFKLSPEVGRLMAEFVASGRRPEGLSELGAGRFREGREIKPAAPFPPRRGSRLP